MDFSHLETIKLIHAFKKHPVIYDVNAVGYYDRRSNSQAWKTISAEVGAHTEICKRKMESLLSSCRREKNKILKSRESNKPEEAYEPKWKFWNDFKFLRGIKDDEEDPLGTVSNVNMTDVCKASAYSQWSTAKMLAKTHKKPENPNPNPPSTSTAIKRPAEPNDEYTAIGVLVEAKLKKMLKSQQVYTQNIINQILYKGLLFQLSSSSEIRETDFPAEDSTPISDVHQNMASHPYLKPDDDEDLDHNAETKRRKESVMSEQDHSLYQF